MLEAAAGRLEIDRLTKYYGGLAAVQDLSFTVRTGEVLGLLGPNGSGKSTTIKVLTGLLQPTRGRVLVDGEPIATDLLRYKASLGYVPEEPHLYSYLTGPEYLRLIGQLRVGLRLDGVRIDSISAVPYRGFTYDLLPSGPTGEYLADGVLLGSTLS